MSGYSDEFIRSTHRGVHEQFNILLSVIDAYKLIVFDLHDEFQSTIRSKQKKFIKNVLKGVLNKYTGKSGLLITGLAMYAYEFWEIAAGQKLGGNITIATLSEFENTMKPRCAAFLDDQFEACGRADVIGFLKEIAFE